MIMENINSNRNTIYEDAESLEDKEKQSNKNSIINNSNISLSIINTSNISNSNTHNTSDIEKEKNIMKKIELEKFRKKELFQEDINHLNQMHDPVEYLTSNFNTIKSKSLSTKRHLKNILEIQNFEGDTDKIWVVQFSSCGKYLATGGKSGVLKIWEVLSVNDSLDIYEKRELLKFTNFFSENAFRIYTEHKKDIIDLSWGNKNPNLIVTVSLDHFAILWDINSTSSIGVYNHRSIIPCVDFYPNTKNLFSENDDDIFVTGSFDRLIRVWSVKDPKEPLLYINVIEYITAIAFFPEGNYLAVGSSDGKISIYDCEKKLRYAYSFNCKNKNGKYSEGRKITSIYFINKNEALITTNDSRIRLIDVNDGNINHKMKGHKNEEGMIKACYDSTYKSVITASEDNYVYLWNEHNNHEVKNYNYEYYKPFDKNKGKITCSMFASPCWVKEFQEKFTLFSDKIVVKSVMINTSSNGFIQVLVNYDLDLKKKSINL